VYSPELLSHGQSSPVTKGIDLQEYVELLGIFHEHVVKVPCMYVGHSLGGAFCLAMAAGGVWATSALVINPLVPPINYSFAEQLFRFTVLKSIGDLLDTKETNCLPTMVSEFSKNIYQNSLRFPLILSALHMLLFDTTLNYGAVQVPVWVLHSDNDVVFPPTYAQHLNKLLPKSTYREVKGGHSWALFCPSMFKKEFDALPAQKYQLSCAYPSLLASSS
jgi:pimeloyl-ACP methyl ester carboxylesterase